MNDDPLGAARGLMWGLILSIPIWTAIGYFIYKLF